MLSRRDWLRYSISGAAAAAVARILPIDALAAEPDVTAPGTLVVYKSATCGCCKQWVKHVEAAGYTVTVHDTEDLSTVKRTFNIPEQLQGCHTALLGKYIIEGHVPADLIRKVEKDKPSDLVGLAVPGMPAGSPGMEMGSRKDPYNVIAFDRAGKTRVYARR